MIDELFELTRLESNQVEIIKDEFAIGDLLSDIYACLEEKAKLKDIDLIIDCEQPEALVLADIAKIERVIQNLVENAIRFSKEGGRVVLCAESINTNTQCLKIKDYGSGIAEQHLPHIFEPYYRASDEYKLKHMGAGLGLAICQRLLLLHDSKLIVDSELGKGTIFSFTLQAS